MKLLSYCQSILLLKCHGARWDLSPVLPFPPDAWDPNTVSHKQAVFPTVALSSVQRASFPFAAAAGFSHLSVWPSISRPVENFIKLPSAQHFKEKKKKKNVESAAFIMTTSHLIPHSAANRPKSLLVYINPYGGRRLGERVYQQKVAPLLRRACISADVIGGSLSVARFCWRLN